MRSGTIFVSLIVLANVLMVWMALDKGGNVMVVAEKFDQLKRGQE